MLAKLDIKEIESIPVFFVLARPRTGSSLLRMLLDAHPHIQIPIESPVILDLYPKYGLITKWDEALFHSFYQDLFKLRRFSEWKIDKDNLKKDLLNCPENIRFQSLCKIVHLNYVSAFPKQKIHLIGDKNPQYSLFPEELMKIFPDARFVHLTRDYRDHYLSMKRADFNQSRLSLIVYNWKESAKKIRKFKKRNAHSVYTLKYEDLVTNPEMELKKVMDFLNMEYHPDALQHHNQKEKLENIYSEESLKKYFGSLLKPITADKVNEWKTQMSDKDIELADGIVGKYAEREGYERKFKKIKPKIVLYMQPRIFVIKFYNIYSDFLLILPSSIQKAFKKIIPGPIKLYTKLFSN